MSATIETAKHTPGPWKFNEFADDTIRADNWGVVATISLHKALAEFHLISEANAHLIAACPDLLKACNKFIQLFRDSDMRPEDECHELYAEFESAIAKAERKPNAS